MSTGDKRRGRPRRGRPPAADGERKDRLIQTRVEEDLDEALRAEARRRRVTVSQLIRNVLHDTFTLVDNIVVETTNLAETVKRDARRLAASAQSLTSGTPAPRRPETDPGTGEVDALGPPDAWQDVTLAKSKACARCQAGLPAGSPGHVALWDGPPPSRAYVCDDCAEALGRPK